MATEQHTPVTTCVRNILLAELTKYGPPLNDAF